MDRHLLYLPWYLRYKISPDGKHSKGPDEPFGPILIDSHIDFKMRQHEEPWSDSFQSLRIHGGRPCIEVSEEEIAALALALGMELRSGKKRDGNFLPHGIGAFGTIMSSEKDDCLAKLKLTYHRRSMTEVKAGSGYSILFAKHMAYGCLPFAFDGVGNEVQTIAITKDVLECLKTGGKAIYDFHASPGIQPGIPSTTQLGRLPHSATINYYHYTAAKPDIRELSSEGPYGNPSNDTIHDIPMHTFIDWKSAAERYKCVGFWCEAVARIAFGGLVPLATEPLIKAVESTVGKHQMTECAYEHLQALMNTIIGYWKKKVGIEVPLFGEDQNTLRQWEVINRPVDFRRRARKELVRTREIVGELSKYTTLLESLMALIREENIGKDNNANTKPNCVFTHDDAGNNTINANKADKSNNDKSSNDSTTNNADAKRESVFTACVSKVRMLYRQYQRSGSNHCLQESESSRPPCTIICAPLKDAKGSVEKGNCEVNTCADVAVCIIILWTKIVKASRTQETRGCTDESPHQLPIRDEEIKSGSTLLNQKHELYSLAPLEELPDVAIWE